MLLFQEGLKGRTAVLEAEGGSATASGKHFRDITIGGLKKSEEINIIFPKRGHSLRETDSSAQQQREVGVAGASNRPGLACGIGTQIDGVITVTNNLKNQ